VRRENLGTDGGAFFVHCSRLWCDGFRIRLCDALGKKNRPFGRFFY
jgi:hypothetical protein